MEFKIRRMGGVGEVENNLELRTEDLELRSEKLEVGSGKWDNKNRN